MILRTLDKWRAGTPKPEKVSWLSTQGYAHRGLHGAGPKGKGRPENSLAAARAALEKGLGIECDVQRSSDGVAMVFHDFELDRLTGEQGPINDRTSAELGQIKLTGGEEGVPTLRQLLDTIDARVPLLIEIKTKGERRFAALCLAVRRVLEGYPGNHAVMSFDPRVVRWFADHSPLTVRGLVVTEEKAKALGGRIKRRLALWHAKPDFLAYDVRDLPSRFAGAQRKRGLPLLTWTVRSPEHRERADKYADAPIAEGAGIL